MTQEPTPYHARTVKKQRTKNVLSSVPVDYGKIRFADIAQSDEDKIIVSHWVHTKDTLFAKPYEKKAKKILSHELFAQIQNQRMVVSESAPSVFFPELFDVPFPPLGEPLFTFIDLFAGIGGFRIALQKAGGQCVFSSEWDESAQKTYFTNYGEMPFGDITKGAVKASIPNKFDVLCAGFPCQPFSISGKMDGFNDARGTLFFDICEIIEKRDPKIIFLENVKHLVHHNRGTTLKVILQTLERLGYLVQEKLLNASDFGVAQNRERIIIIGTQKQPFDFGAVQTKPRVFLHEIVDKDGVFEYLAPDEYTLIPSPKRQDSGLIFAGYRNKSIRKAGVRDGTEHLSRVHKQPNRIYSVAGVHPTLPSQESSGRFFILTAEKRVRKLTISECYKLMGFPVEFKMSPTPSAQYVQIGNSVCVPMIQAIGDAFLTQGLL